MAKLQMYAVHDSAVGAFLPPLYFRSRGEAVRSFQDAVSDGKSNFASHPEHYSFWFVGEYDDESAAMSCESQVRVCGANDFIIK